MTELLNAQAQKWFHKKTIDLPIEGRDGRELDALNGRCATCGKNTTDPRGEIACHRDGGLDVAWIALCEDCGLLCFFFLQWNANGDMNLKRGKRFSLDAIKAFGKENTQDLARSRRTVPGDESLSTE
jgi:hypothetical protein